MTDVRILGLEITDRCDLACGHCLRAVVPPHAQRARDLDVDLARRLAREAAALGIPQVGITGGEPTLHPRFLDILDGAADAGLKVHFVTNGMGLPVWLPRILERPARRAALNQVCVSLDGATAGSHDAVRGQGSFARALAGIAVLRAARVPFVILSVIARTNKHEIDQMGLLAHHLGAKMLLFSHFLPNGRPYATADLDLTIPERHRAEDEVKRLMDAMRFQIVMGEGYFTEAGDVDHQCAPVAGRALNVDPSGHLTFCCELSNFHGDGRPPAERDDWLADLATISLADGAARAAALATRFRAERLADEAAGRRGEDDRFACRYCVRHFGKPEREIVPLRRTARAGAR